MKSCPEDPDQWSNTIQIHPVGIEEKLTATVFLDCDCPCERPETTVGKLRLVSYHCQFRQPRRLRANVVKNSQAVQGRVQGGARGLSLPQTQKLAPFPKNDES